MRRVVVTGLGAVCPIGNDVQTIWENALKGTSGVGPVTRFDASQFGCQIAAEVKDFDVEKYVRMKTADSFILGLRRLFKPFVTAVWIVNMKIFAV